MRVVAALIKSIRPHQWVKNVFVAAPLVFSRHLNDATYVGRTALAVLAFCLLSGAVYTYNDVRDVEADRAHPKKRHRPIAAGLISERGALAYAAALAIVALVTCLLLSPKLAAFAAAYFVQNIAYSVRLKHVAFVDVLMIANGFFLRVLAGAAAIDVPASEWLLLCTALLALFFGFGKRAHELSWALKAGSANTTRAALSGYRLPPLRVIMLVLAIVTAAAYVAYTIDERTVTFFGTDRLIYSAPFVALGLFRFLQLALWRPKDDSPTEAMLKDPWCLLAFAGAMGTILYVIYGS
jgi:4-hydroxybenzoate polyprenyltransferase